MCIITFLFHKFECENNLYTKVEIKQKEEEEVAEEEGEGHSERGGEGDYALPLLLLSARGFRIDVKD